MRVRSILILLFVLLIAGGYLYFTSVPKPPPPENPKIYVWLVEMEDIKHIKVDLPSENMSQSFVLQPDRSWRFDDPQLSPVDMQRWGGGIPLLLSGPAADRIIEREATPERLAEFGLAEPRMKVELVLKDDSLVNIDIGNLTPGGNAFYVKAPDSSDVAIVDYSWFYVIQRLVTEPPYAKVEGN